MRHQLLTVPKEGLLAIATPNGLITIKRGEAHFRLEIEMPEDLRAYKSSERAVSHSRYLRTRNGRLEPAYAFLVPVVDRNGGLIGVKNPATLKVGAKQA